VAKACKIWHDFGIWTTLDVTFNFFRMDGDIQNQTSNLSKAHVIDDTISAATWGITVQSAIKQ